MMNIKDLIRDNIVKIIEDASYLCAFNWGDAKRDHTTQKFQAMTNSFDTHLTILLRNYKDETIVSVYPWPTEMIDEVPVPYYFNNTELPHLLDEMKVYIVPADLDLLNWIGNSSDRNNDFSSIIWSLAKKTPTAFFKIKYSEGKSFRDCFESIRSVVIGNCLSKRAA